MPQRPIAGDHLLAVPRDPVGHPYLVGHPSLVPYPCLVGHPYPDGSPLAPHTEPRGPTSRHLSPETGSDEPTVPPAGHSQQLQGCRYAAASPVPTGRGDDAQ